MKKLHNWLFAMLLAGLVACNPPTSPPPTNTPVNATESPTVAPPNTNTPTTEPTNTPIIEPTTQPSDTPSGECAPTDQDQYVYHPARLTVKAACIRVTGIVETIRIEADGDLHIRLRLDPQYTSLLTSGNSQQQGDMVVEPICVKPVTQADAIDSCKADPDPLTTLPTEGQSVWMEGRYVLDTEHSNWAELHPLYRWGVLAQTPTAPTMTPAPAKPTNTRAPVLPTNTPAPVIPTETEPPQATPAPSGFTLTQLTSPVSKGGNATATIQTVPGASCTITYVTPSGNVSQAQGLGPQTANGNGVCSWTWKISSNTNPGTGTVTITANGVTQSLPIEIQ